LWRSFGLTADAETTPAEGVDTGKLSDLLKLKTFGVEDEEEPERMSDFERTFGPELEQLEKRAAVRVISERESILGIMQYWLRAAADGRIFCVHLLMPIEFRGNSLSPTVR
jgi:hypothetical protein